MNVELRIERLVLTGLDLPPAGRSALAGAFGRELTRLIRDGGLSPGLLGGTAAPRLTVTLGPAAGSGSGAPLGRALARSVYSGLGPNLSPSRP